MSKQDRVIATVEVDENGRCIYVEEHSINLHEALDEARERSKKASKALKELKALKSKDIKVTTNGEEKEEDAVNDGDEEDADDDDDEDEDDDDLDEGDEEDVEEEDDDDDADEELELEVMEFKFLAEHGVTHVICEETFLDERPRKVRKYLKRGGVTGYLFR